MFAAFTSKKRYSEYSNEELMSTFRSENWDKLSHSKRIKVLQEVENRNAASQGRKPCTVKSVNSKNDYGSYYAHSNRIEVNVNDSIKDADGKRISNSSYQVLDTIYHEGEHAHQTNCVKNQIGPPQGLPDTTRDLCKVEDSEGVYPEFDENGKQIDGLMDYNHCTCEIDSNNVAARKVLASRGQFRGDIKFDEYLANREGYFENASNLNMSIVRMQQGASADLAYKNGDISQQKLDDIHKLIHSDQPAFSEAKNLRDVIKAERIENQKSALSADTVRARSVNNSESASSPSLRDRVIHPSPIQTAKIARNMNDSMKAHDQGYQTMKGYRAGKFAQSLNACASSKGVQSLVGKSTVSDSAHTYDAARAIKHPEERINFNPSPISAQERASHTLEVKMPSTSDKRASFSSTMKGGRQTETSVAAKREAFRASTQSKAPTTASHSAKREGFRSVMSGKTTSTARSTTPQKTSGAHNSGTSHSTTSSSRSNSSSNKVKR